MYQFSSDHIFNVCVYLINSGQIFNILLSPLQVFLPLFQIFLQIYFSTTWGAKYNRFLNSNLDYFILIHQSQHSVNP